jgi:N6-L-threonylcarbamoyladenine synthase
VIKNILAIETSCDDTSVAIISENGFVKSMVSANQDLVHAPFGGVVPEIASRSHLETLMPLIEVALSKASLDLKQIDAIAVTSRPGLIGSLIVGVVTAKTLGQALDIPVIGVNHLEGHLFSPLLRDEKWQPPQDFKYPYIGLIVSGGHTAIYHVEDFGKYKILGATRDDAAGEAWDKFGKMLGLEFPGGVKVDQLAQAGDPKSFAFPRSMISEESYEMSFSGLKSSAQRLVSQFSTADLEMQKANLCASFQEAIVDVLLAKLDRAVTLTNVKRIVIAGGVSANSHLRQRSADWARNKGISLLVPPLKYCTDNAAMIGGAGLVRLQRGEFDNLKLVPKPHSHDEDFFS